MRLPEALLKSLLEPTALTVGDIGGICRIFICRVGGFKISDFLFACLSPELLFLDRPKSGLRSSDCWPPSLASVIS
jgi:hypothetical protein